MGASISHSLARRRKTTATLPEVALVDASHAVRGSWGESRAVHLAQADGLMLRMCRQSIGLWRQLEESTGQPILIHAGRVNMSPRGHLDKLVAAYDDHGIQYNRVQGGTPAAEAAHPQFAMQPSEEAVSIREGYVARAAVALHATTEAAKSAGTVLLQDEPVVTIDLTSKTLTTESGRTVKWRSELVMAAGGWTNSLLSKAGLPKLPLHVSAEQTVQFGVRRRAFAPLYDVCTQPANEGFSATGMPLLTYKKLEPPGHERWFYVVPHIPDGCDGVKVGYHQQGPVMDTPEFMLQEPGKVAWDQLLQQQKRLVQEFDSGLDQYALEASQAFVQKALPGLDPARVELFMRCLYNNVTGDGDFIIGRLAPGVVVATGFSGEGFKHAPLIGEFVAALCQGHCMPDNIGGAAAVGGVVVPRGTPPLFMEMQQRFDPMRFNKQGKAGN